MRQQIYPLMDRVTDIPLVDNTYRLDWIHFIVIVQSTKLGFVTNQKCRRAVKCSLYMNYTVSEQHRGTISAVYINII